MLGMLGMLKVTAGQLQPVHLPTTGGGGATGNHQPWAVINPQNIQVLTRGRGCVPGAGGAGVAICRRPGAGRFDGGDD